MTIPPAERSDSRSTLRLWPGVIAAVLLLARLVVPIAAPGFEGFGIAMLSGLLGTLVTLVWWVFLSRSPPVERWGAVLLMSGALAATWILNHESMRLMWFVSFGLPVLCLSLVAWAVLTRGLEDGFRRSALVATVVAASAPWTLIRMEGLTGDHSFQFAWRWAETGEQRLLARLDEGTAELSPASRDRVVEAEWPGFRGPGRDGVVPGVRIDVDWSASPPVELWRRPVGPGWSSFAVRGGVLYTQEQRGENEVVACHDVATGEPLWRHRDTTRFFEAMGGAGPRATPALDGDRVYALGATGILNALDAVDGRLIWSRNVSDDTGTEIPMWGYSSSPLVMDDTVIVAADGKLVAYEAASGEPRWSGPHGGPSYSSPHPSTLGGVAQILLLSNAGAAGVAPDGTPLWEHAWPGASIVQPALTPDGDLLISAGEGKGIRRIAVTPGPEGWATEERWTSNRLKPNFNDFVVHEGHAFGFDGAILACIDLEDGERRWKGGRYGHGQLILLADQDALLVVSERGEVALVGATPDRFQELARHPAIEGKTWNHPALVGDVLLLRNGQEMAAFRLPRAAG